MNNTPILSKEEFNQLFKRLPPACIVYTSKNYVYRILINDNLELYYPRGAYTLFLDKSDELVNVNNFIYALHFYT